MDNFKCIKTIYTKNRFLSLGVMKKNRERAINIASLNYQDQKEFFALDKAYNQVFVDRHEKKVKLDKDQLSKALMANLKRERILQFKQFLHED